MKFRPWYSGGWAFHHYPSEGEEARERRIWVQGEFSERSLLSQRPKQGHWERMNDESDLPYGYSFDELGEKVRHNKIRYLAARLHSGDKL